jgi:hypothetical protein
VGREKTMKEKIARDDVFQAAYFDINDDYMTIEWDNGCRKCMHYRGITEMEDRVRCGSEEKAQELDNNTNDEFYNGEYKQYQDIEILSPEFYGESCTCFVARD